MSNIRMPRECSNQEFMEEENSCSSGYETNEPSENDFKKSIKKIEYY